MKKKITYYPIIYSETEIDWLSRPIWTIFHSIVFRKLVNFLGKLNQFSERFWNVETKFWLKKSALQAN